MSDVRLEHPGPDDGLPVWQLVKDTGVLDVNSSYAYGLVLTHFGRTSVVVRHEGGVGGFITAWIPPEKPDTLFVWQVGVDASMRGRGLATRMLEFLLDCEAARHTRFLETTVTPDNEPSRRLFAGLARKRGTELVIGEPFLTTEQLGSGHAPEELFRIGPIDRSDA